MELIQSNFPHRVENPVASRGIFDVNNNDHLQYVFACLSTHSKWVKMIRKNFEIIHNHFHLNHEDKRLLQTFIYQYGKRLQSTAILMEEKRWREVLLSINHIIKLIPYEILKLYWQDYLNNFDLNEHIPSSSILESICFMTFLLKQISHTDSNEKLLQKAVIEYELMRNTAFSYEFHSNENSYPSCPDINNIDLQSYRAVLNPSFIKKHFSLPVSQIITPLQHDQLHAKTDYTHVDKKNELIAFYKKISTGHVTCIHLNSNTDELLTSLTMFATLSAWLEHTEISMKINKIYCMHFVKNMMINEIIYLGSADISLCRGRNR